MKKILAALLLSIGVPVLAAIYPVEARANAGAAQERNAVAPASAITAPTLVSAYLVAKGGENNMVTGGTLQFTAYGRYSDGSVGPLPDAQGNSVTLWNTSDHSVVKISSGGHATAMGGGTVNIEATIGALIATPVAVTVSAASGSTPLVTCSANPAFIYQGGTAIITANGSSTQGLPLGYSYSVSAGSINGSDAIETLNTTGAPAGLVTVTCTVNQADGRTASATTNVLLHSIDPGVAQDTTITYPVSGSTVPFPAWVVANSGGCDGGAPVSLAYSVDNGMLLTSGVTASEIDAPDRTISAGTHTIYFKSSTSNGDCPAVGNHLHRDRWARSRKFDSIQRNFIGQSGWIKQMAVAS